MNLKNKKEVNETWSIIPARSNSKSIRSKNLQKISNKTLIQHAIIVSKKTKLIKRTFVSTEKKSILNKSIRWGSEKIELRNKKFARDSATDFDVVKDFLTTWLKRSSIYPKYLILLRPTTPLRNFKLLNNAIKKFRKLKSYNSMLTVSKMPEPAFKKLMIRKRKLYPILKKMKLDDANRPRQFFNSTYSGNGYLDIIKTKNIFNGSYLGKNCFPLIIKAAIDIDTKEDLILARLIFKNKSKFSKSYEV